MTRRLILSLWALLLLVACDALQSEPLVAEGTLTAKRYHHAGLGWRMPLPSGWTVLSRDEIRKITGKGREVMEQSTGEPIEELQTDLLYLRGGAAGSGFTSARQPLDRAAGPYPEQQSALFDVLEKAYHDAGFPVRIERRQETIDGVVFAVMFVSLRSRDGGHEFGQSYMYDALLGEQSLTVSVTALSATEREAGLKAWRASTFQRRGSAPRAPSP